MACSRVWSQVSKGHSAIAHIEDVVKVPIMANLSLKMSLGGAGTLHNEKRGQLLAG